MSRDSTWEEVWAEYDARQASHAEPATMAAPLAEPRPARRRSGGNPPRLVVGALLAVLVVVLGLPFGEAGAPAVAGQDQILHRQDMIVVGLAGETEMAESPAGPPPAAQLLAEAVLVPMPPPAWVQPGPAPAMAAAEPVAAARPQRAAQQARRTAHTARAPRQLASSTAAPEQPWFDGSASLQTRRQAARHRAAPLAQPEGPTPLAAMPDPTHGRSTGRGLARGSPA